MRISTAQIQRQGINAILERQASLAKTEIQLATGKKNVTPSDDPAAAKRVMDLNQIIEITEQFKANANIATSRQNLQESAIDGVETVLIRVKELAVRGNVSFLSDADRRGIAAEVSQRLGELVGLANTQDANGEYLFSGYKSNTRPFAEDGSYSGDEGRRFLQISATMQVTVSDSGTEVFRAIRNGNGTFQTQEAANNSGNGRIDPGSVTDFSQWVPDTYTIRLDSPSTYVVTDSSAAVVTTGNYVSGDAIIFNGIQTTITENPASGDSFTVSPSTNQDIFTTVANLVTALETPITDTGASLAHYHNAMSRFLTDVDRAQERVATVRTKAGARLNEIESQQAINENILLYSRQNLSQTQDLDYAEAIGRMNLELLGLESAQQAFVKVQGLSLFKFL